jgi:starch synthase
MYIVQVASECAPVIKAGGLGDVVYGLSRRWNAGPLCGADSAQVRLHALRPHLGLHHAYLDLKVPWYGADITCTVHCGWVHGRLCFFIEPHSQDMFFRSRVLLRLRRRPHAVCLLQQGGSGIFARSNKRPDVIHCHDWQTGLIPVMLFEMYKYNGMEYQRVLYSIHNFKHQGFGGTEVLQATGLNREYYFQYDRLRDNFNPFSLNFMKGGIVYSNHVNTVSPHHAWEARHGNQRLWPGAHPSTCISTSFPAFSTGLTTRFGILNRYATFPTPTASLPLKIRR